ncbi:uncharacterized protein BDCG_17545, partial [Blastomyces dermatitidis ER-3]
DVRFSITEKLIITSVKLINHIIEPVVTSVTLINNVSEPEPEPDIHLIDDEDASDIDDPNST